MGLGTARPSAVRPGREGPRRVCTAGGWCVGHMDGAEVQGAFSVLTTRGNLSRGPEHVPAAPRGAGHVGTALPQPAVLWWDAARRPQHAGVLPPRRAPHQGAGACAPFLRCTLSPFAFEQFASRQLCTLLDTQVFKRREPQSEPLASVCSSLFCFSLFPTSGW